MTFKEFLQKKGISDTDFAAKSAEETAQLQNEYNVANQKEINERIEKAATKEQLDEIKSELETDYKAEIKKVQDHANELDVKLQGKTIKGEPKELIVKEIKENKESLVKVMQGGAKEVEIKALTTRASIANNASGFFLPNIGQLGVKERSLYNVLPKSQVTSNHTGGTIRYYDWDEATTVRAAAAIAEGAAFPEATATFAWYTKDLRKIGDTLPVTEEFFEDEEQAANELQRFLEVNVSTEIDNQIVNGDDTGQNLEGLITSAPAYTAVASGISTPNLKDLTIKMRNDITRTRGSKYRVDILVVASSTMEDLVLAKDANNNYIFDENTGTLGGLSVVVDENMPDNQIIVGDRRYATIYEKAGTTISRGMPGNQFNEDEMTIKARRRLLLLVRTVDRTGFRKVTDVDAALAILAT